MSIFSKLSEKYHYLLDSCNASRQLIKIDHFSLDMQNESINVAYRIGRQKLLNKMNILNFEKEYFDKVTSYDQHRLTKFSIMQNILVMLFDKSSCNKENYIAYLSERIKSEQLF